MIVDQAPSSEGGFEISSIITSLSMAYPFPKGGGTMRAVAVLTVTGILSQLIGFGYRVLLTRLAGAEILGLYLKGLSYAEIAAHVDRPPKSVDNAVQRIRRKVAQQFL